MLYLPMDLRVFCQLEFLMRLFAEDISDDMHERIQEWVSEQLSGCVAQGKARRDVQNDIEVDGKEW